MREHETRCRPVPHTAHTPSARRVHEPMQWRAMCEPWEKRARHTVRRVRALCVSRGQSTLCRAADAIVPSIGRWVWARRPWPFVVEEAIELVCPRARGLDRRTMSMYVDARGFDRRTNVCSQCRGCDPLCACQHHNRSCRGCEPLCADVRMRMPAERGVVACVTCSTIAVHTRQ
jgi:hypothetical protein